MSRPQRERAVGWQETTRPSGLLDEAIRRYQNRTLSTAETIAELVELGRNHRGAQGRGVALGLRDDELAFHDAICENEAAVLELGDDVLNTIARELVIAVRESATIDWNVKETVRAAMRARIRRLLNRYGYPPDRQERQAELLAGGVSPPSTSRHADFTRKLRDAVDEQSRVGYAAGGRVRHVGVAARRGAPGH